MITKDSSDKLAEGFCFMKLERRLGDLIRDLLSPGEPNISTNRNYPFAFFQYSLHKEFTMRTKLIEQIDVIRDKGRTILNVDLFSTLDVSL